MLCPRCSKSIPDDSAYCCYCGRSIIRQQPSHVHQRGNGTGTAYRRGKTWTAKATEYITRDSDGTPHLHFRTKGGFKTKNEALAYAATVLSKSKSAPRSVPSLLDYWNTYHSGEYQKLSESKKSAYKIAWRKLKPLWHTPIDRITVNDLRSTVSAAAPTYYPARDMKVVCSHLFSLAAADRFADKSLPEYIVLPDLHEKERRIFTMSEQQSLWQLYEQGDLRAAIPLIMIYTGMMPGEMQSLKTDMVHLDARQIIGVGMKTKVRRDSPLYLPDCILPVLSDCLDHAQPSGYVWPHSSDIFYDTYYAALESASCRRLEPYCCRHTTATALAITENIAPQTIKKIMRWSTTKMLDRYAHPDSSDALAAINTLTRAQTPSSIDENP